MKLGRNPLVKIARGLVLIAALFASACATLRHDYVKQPSTALPPSTDSVATREVFHEAAAHPGESGFRPLVRNTDALMSRIVLADHAVRSIDLQYYIFDNDATGRLLAQHLLAAADRGVRVRILLDDLGINKEDHLLDALDAHPNIEVRLFNPLHLRNRALWSKVLQFAVDGARLNRRMHNKSFTVDNMLTIIGGRNIGDAYFSAGDDVHFRDLDVLAIGPVVPEVSKVFDEYFNSDSAFPVTAFRGRRATEKNVAKARARLADSARTFADSDYAQAMARTLPNGPSAELHGEWDWGVASVIADDPDKVDPDQDTRSLHIVHDIKTLLDGAREHIEMVSPYFIPGEKGTDYLAGLVKRGVAIEVLTNSLSATDEPEVHAGYSRYRRPLLEAGIGLYELRPAPGKQRRLGHGASSGVSLHAKTMVVDGRRVFVGSMNLDPRSRGLNTEMGVIVDSPTLADAIAKFFARATKPANAFKVTLAPKPGQPRERAPMIWTATDDDKPVTFDHDPDTSALRRAEVSLLRVLPIESLL